MRTLLALCIGLVLLPVEASAKRVSPLEGQPAIRHRQELRKGRFELGPSFGISLNRYVRHAFLVGAKLEYHINDWISIGADAGYGIGMDTALTGEIAKQYADEQPQWENLRRRFSDVQFAGDVRVSVTPFSGKIGLFSRLFVAYDFYAFAGFGFALLKNGGTPFGAEAADDIDAATAGFRPGAAWGLGMHLFFNRFVGMGFEIRDIMYADNQFGGDMTRGLTDEEKARATSNPTRPYLINGDDKKFDSHFFVGINLTFYLPPRIDISR